MITRVPSLEKPFSKTSLPRESRFKEGEVLKGTVIQNYGGGEVLVVSRGKQFRAHTALNLTVGEEHRFQVKAVGKRIELAVLSDARTKPLSPAHLWAAGREGRDRLSQILTELSAGHALKCLQPETRVALKGLAQFLPAIISNDSKGDQAQWMSRTFLGNGLFWENKVARFVMTGKGGPLKTLSATDLKGSLLALNKILMVEEQDHPEIASLSRKVTEAVSLIEQEQILNLSLLREDGGVLLFVPGHAEDGFKQGELYVKGAKGSEGVSISMHLEFTWLGQVDVAVTLVESLLTVQILLEDGERAGLVTTNLPVLEAGLKETGFVLGSLGCRVREGEARDEIPAQEEDTAGHSVDVVI
jgi:hypothetical protein